MPADYTSYAIDKTNFIEESRNILYEFINYWATEATIAADGVDGWGTGWVVVNAAPDESPPTTGDLRDKCYITIERIVPFANRLRGNYDLAPTTSDHIILRRCNALITLGSHRMTNYRIEQAYANLLTQFEERQSELADEEIRRIVLSQRWNPTQADRNPERMVSAFLIDFEVSVLIDVQRA